MTVELYDGSQNLDEYVVKFYADWCGPCKIYAPLFERLAELDGDKKYISVNVDTHPSAAREADIRAVPTVLFEGEKLENYMQWTRDQIVAAEG